MRAINHYRLDGEDPSILAAGHTVFDLGISRRIRRGIELNLTIDNVTDRSYYEVQNYFESRLQGQDPAYRIHATPGYPLTVMAGITFRFRGK
jgi:outer membrane receptor protein involved in Fe transport